MTQHVKEELSESGTEIGIEADDEEESILEPFDPNSISIEQKVVPMDTLIRRLKQGSIHLTPDFQRSEVWDPTRKSRLIESLMLRVPLPMFYVAANEEGKWEVVDGLQRLSTIRDFIIGDYDGVPLRLRNLEFLGEKFNGKTFSGIESDPSQQKLINGILETEMRFTVINPGTPESVKRNIFKRINTGGMPLTAQEIRHALYQGKSTKLLTRLVNSDEFKNATERKINDTRMGARELILRFLSFLVIERSSYRSNMDTWMSNTMRVINCMPDLDPAELDKIFTKQEIPIINFSNEEEVIAKFRIAMTRSAKLFDGHAFRKSVPGDRRKTPINKSLFETWSNVLCEINEEEFKAVLSKKEQLLSDYKYILESEEFASSISRNASKATSINFRYAVIQNLVQNLITKET